jgi:hypothetical protein
MERGACSAIVHSAPWWVEPAIASCAFLVWLLFFRACELGSGFLLRAPRQSLRLLAALARSTSFESPHAFTVRAFSALGAYWVGIYLWTSVVPPVSGALAGCPTSGADAVLLVAELVSGVVGYDFIFFWLHLAMHASPRIGRAVGHAQHHAFDGHGGEDGSESAFRTVNHALLDGSLQVLSNILVQRHTPWGAPKSKLARWAHNVLVTFLLVEAHTTAPAPRVFRRLFAGVRDHHLHHRHRGAPYQQARRLPSQPCHLVPVPA